MRSPIEYEERLLAFVDILGWTELVKLSATDQAARELVAQAIDVIERGMRLQRASESGAAFGPKFDAKAKYSFISDTFMMSTAAAASNVPYFTSGVADLCCDLLDLGLASRGAIVVGKLIHDGNRIYGPILAVAAHFEKHVAVFPRILVTPEASAILSRFASFQRDHIDNREFLHVLSDRVSNNAESLERMRLHAQANVKRFEGDEHVQSKYRWLVTYIAGAQQEAQVERLNPKPPLRFD